MRTLQSLFLIATALLLGSGCNFNTLDDKSKFTLIPGRANTVEAFYDQPVTKVETAVRNALSRYGTITEEKRLPVTGEETTKLVFSARIDTRHVRVSVKSNKETPAYTNTYVQAWTTSRNPDLQVAFKTDREIYLVLFNINNPQQQTSN